jgi:hypothetical protein
VAGSPVAAIGLGFRHVLGATGQYPGQNRRGQVPAECLELPRPTALLRTIGWNIAESFGLPTGGYALAAWLGGRDAGLWAMLGAIWLTAVIRKLVTGSVPGLVAISLMVLTVQTLAAIITGNLWIFLLHFPLANLGLCLLLAVSLGASTVWLRSVTRGLGIGFRFA